MNKKDFIDDLAARLKAALPQGASTFKEDIEKNIHAVLQKAFAKLELVTREEFDTQTKVLARTRQKLEALEKEVKTLESKYTKKS